MPAIKKFRRSHQNREPRFVLKPLTVTTASGLAALTTTIATKALPSSKAVEPVSGAIPVSENAPLKVGAGLPPTMSVPIREPVRIQIRVRESKLADPGANTVLGETSGLVADNHKKVVISASELYLRHEKIMTRRKVKRIGEIYIEMNLFACERSVTARGLIG